MVLPSVMQLSADLFFSALQTFNIECNIAGVDNSM